MGWRSNRQRKMTPVSVCGLIKFSTTLQKCTVVRAIRNVDAQLELLHRWPAVVNSIDLLHKYGTGTSKWYKEPVTTDNTVVSNCEKKDFRRSSGLAEAKFPCLPYLYDMPSTNHFFDIFAQKSASQWFWWGFLGCLFSDAQSCCIKNLTKFPKA